jgi:hypothetical protein
MIVSKSQSLESQATLPKELSGPLASCAKLAIGSVGIEKVLQLMGIRERISQHAEYQR